MTLKVFNTLTKQKEEFVPLTPGKVKMYVCGVTPYNHPHIGNARPFITWDVIRRYLEYSGYDVFHVQNFTDVDDKIINAAKSEQVTWDVIANRYIASYFEVMDTLNIRRAQVYPRVSDHIPEIIAMIKTLVDKGFAYPVAGDVYYSVEQFPQYGKLSGRNLEDMKAGARVDVDERKQHPMDFALWKSAKPGEPAWDSPWGPGRPGWHIECSVMSYKYLGASFDFHGGGSDLVFPHHENEIAQSEAFTGVEPFVRFWLHNGFITVNEEKMSKSLGNFFLVIDILEHFRPEVLRFFILSTHYRSPLDFSDERLEEAGRSLERLKTASDNLIHLATFAAGSASGDSQALVKAAAASMAEFVAAMDDDFNTALAISTMFGLAKEINIYHSKVAAGKAGLDKEALTQVDKTYSQMADIIGIRLAGTGAAAQDSNTELVNELMQLIIDIRQEARQKKDWATADQIRDKLAVAGIVLEDSPQGRQVEKTVNFDHFQKLVDNLFTFNEAGKYPPAKYHDIDAGRLAPLVLAYVGDAYFTLYVRTRLLGYEQNKVRVLHTFDAKIVSAVMQSKAVKALEDQLSPAEADIVRRGRNAKSTVPKSASISEYRYATGFEALMGYLYLEKKHDRLSEIADKAFAIISREMTAIAKK